jgi:hypothetical protein
MQAQSVSAIESQSLLLKQIEIEDRLLHLSFKLKGFGSETILQQPSLPEKPQEISSHNYSRYSRWIHLACLYLPPRGVTRGLG